MHLQSRGPLKPCKSNCAMDGKSFLKQKGREYNALYTALLIYSIYYSRNDRN